LWPPHGCNRRPLSRFSVFDVCERAWDLGLTLSYSTVWRRLHEDALRPWLFQQWLFPRDPLRCSPSSRQFFGWDEVETGPPPHQLSDEQLSPAARWASAFYTVPVVNAPRQVEADVLRGLQRLQTFAEEPLRREETVQMAELRTGFEAGRREFLETQDRLTTAFPAAARPSCSETAWAYTKKRKTLEAAPRLVVIDEAARLTMPGLEKRLSRYGRLSTSTA